MSKDEIELVKNDQSVALPPSHSSTQPSVNKEKALKRLNSQFWRRYLWIPFLLAFPLSLFITINTGEYKTARVIEESIVFRPSLRTKKFHVDYGINTILILSFVYISHLGIIQTSTVLLTKLQDLYEES